MDFTPVNAAHEYAIKPKRLIRITDSESFIKYSPESGFDVDYSSRYVGRFCNRLTVHSVTHHLEWSHLTEWKGLISLCGTERKAQREIEWRRRKRRGDITTYYISTVELSWKTLQWNDQITIDVLVDPSEEVMVFKATELIQKLGLGTALRPEVRAGVRDEWMAWEWIPKGLIDGWKDVDGEVHAIESVFADP